MTNKFQLMPSHQIQLIGAITCLKTNSGLYTCQLHFGNFYSHINDCFEAVINEMILTGKSFS